VDPTKRLDALDIDGVSADVMLPDDQNVELAAVPRSSRRLPREADKYSHAQRREGAA
jgi:hypothetical protein